ncbi:hypothetical protein PSOLE_09890 [Pseudomonas oleovorans subsp. oleovorans]|jgi:hypothetical protein|uniref:Uncharacterized protein n=1 Tax=Ectopseudomonas oleovorans TaxID=301 RepID=A0A379JP89_ECTOL|nr:hypothetical protein PSOLE_09890 [Pseudomonas oleovorans subsp. oleovorans]SEJ17088.1 hypothetical protein SAMN05216280_101363 [Pseudomonas oleovorans]SUD50154.1 Uncharacterised protein [Pseudomonas oleovorans]
MDQPVAVEGHDEAQRADQVDVGVATQRAHRFDGLGGQQGIADEKAQVNEHHEQQRQYRADHAELGAALNHLRDTQFRPLGRVRGHEDGAN